jgi:hypothetical protein
MIAELGTRCGGLYALADEVLLSVEDDGGDATNLEQSRGISVRLRACSGRSP